MRERNVTCTGCEGRCVGRARCGTFGRGPALRPAFRRAPPHVNGNARVSWPSAAARVAPDILNVAIPYLKQFVHCFRMLELGHVAEHSGRWWSIDVEGRCGDVVSLLRRFLGRA